MCIKGWFEYMYHGDRVCMGTANESPVGSSNAGAFPISIKLSIATECIMRARLLTIMAHICESTTDCIGRDFPRNETFSYIVSHAWGQNRGRAFIGVFRTWHTNACRE
jgi:hypothetical protein